MDNLHPDPDSPQGLWLAERRRQVIEYLDRVRLVRGDVGDIPACSVHPYVSLWPVESVRMPGYIGWWVICGDCPTHYITATADQSARTALAVIASQWREAVPYLARGEQHPEFSIGDPALAITLAPLIEERAAALIVLAEDEDLWAQ